MSRAIGSKGNGANVPPVLSPPEPWCRQGDVTPRTQETGGQNPPADLLSASAKREKSKVVFSRETTRFLFSRGARVLNGNMQSSSEPTNDCTSVPLLTDIQVAQRLNVSVASL